MTVSDRDDWREQEARMAEAKAHHERGVLLFQWCNAGHIKVMEDNDPMNVRLRIEGEVFGEKRSVFPSVELIAKLQLAIHAGRSEHNCIYADDPIDSHATQAMRYGLAVHKSRLLDALETGYANAAKITVAVNPPRKAPRP